MAESQRSDLLRRENAVMLVPAMASASRHASDLTALWALVCPPGPVFTALISCCFSKDVQVMLIATCTKVKNIQEGREQIFPCECPAVSSLFDASAMKTRKGRTGAWAVHRLAPNELPPFLAKRRKRFARTVVAATNTQAWQITPVA